MCGLSNANLNFHIKSVYDLGLELFRDEIISFPVINEHLKATLLNMIALERQKEVIEWY
jgi:hypothetical protein